MLVSVNRFPILASVLLQDSFAFIRYVATPRLLQPIGRTPPSRLGAEAGSRDRLVALAGEGTWEDFVDRLRAALLLFAKAGGAAGRWVRCFD